MWLLDVFHLLMSVRTKSSSRSLGVDEVGIKLFHLMRMKLVAWKRANLEFLKQLDWFSWFYISFPLFIVFEIFQVFNRISDNFSVFL